MNLDGYVTIVTGGAHGAGAAIIRRFAAFGARIMIGDIDEEAGHKLSQEILAEKGQVEFARCDITKRLDIQNLLKATIEAYGNIDTLVNCVTCAKAVDFLALSEQDFDAMLEVNLKGAFLLNQAVALQMVRQIEKDQLRPSQVRYCLLNTSSVNALVTSHDQLGYGLGMAGLNQMTKSMALALAGRGIRVNALGRSAIATRGAHGVQASARMREHMIAHTPLGRIGEADEIASLAAFLASDAASYITGQCIYADGGFLAVDSMARYKQATDRAGHEPGIAENPASG